MNIVRNPTSVFYLLSILYRLGALAFAVDESIDNHTAGDSCRHSTAVIINSVNNSVSAAFNLHPSRSHANFSHSKRCVLHVHTRAHTLQTAFGQWDIFVDRVPPRSARCLAR